MECLTWSEPRTQAYVMRRTAQGMSNKEIQRCLKRYIVRELYPIILADLSDAATITWHRSVNAPTESWFNSFKNERAHGLRYETRAEMAAMSFEYIEVLYNRKRQHSTLGYKSPMRFLNDWLISQQKKKLIA